MKGRKRTSLDDGVLAFHGDTASVDGASHGPAHALNASGNRHYPREIGKV